MYVSENAGFRCDLSNFKDVQGNLEVTIYCVLYVIIGHGLFDASRFVLFYFEGPPTG